MINGKDLIECIIDHFGKVNAKQLQKIAYLTELEMKGVRKAAREVVTKIRAPLLII